MTRPHDLSLVAQVAGLADGTLDPRELTAHYLDRIGRLADLGAFAEVTPDAALRRAAALDRAETGPLWGVPLADKDLVARAGVPTRYGSRARAHLVPTASDPLADALDAAGAVNVGKTTTSEFGLTGFTEPLIHAPARDPWRLGAGAGGSSGGAAVAVAAGLLPAAVGSDGGGSIRIPSATVGVVGLKPSRGRLPIGSGFDSPDGLSVTGPIARSAEDAGLLLDALVGLAPFTYATAAPGSGPFVEAARRRPGRLRVGVTTVSPWDDDENILLDADARAAFDITAEWLSDDGHAVTDADWRPFGYASLFHVLWRASAARIPLSDDDMTLVEPLTAWLVREGRRLSALDLLGGLASARAFERRTIADFAAFDVVLTPALAQRPQPVGAYAGHSPERTFAMQVEYAPYSSFVNVAGLPALTLPVTTDAAGHPVSVQLIGRPGGEATLLSLAAQLERRRGPLPHPPAWEA
ncbi:MULTISPECIES: amidase [Microbacterium]|uniref:amidase n=1 Tax=Microbacterium TaxID=33882 RepID=UPI00278527B6|nr:MULTISPECIES: amidase [Microbacterium]MDQ1083391.1 amidase [Microbacterium sp. SORGH_AS_0344]MDQ1171329.1 amidase [Microbacterium proteolyticum]